MTCFALGTLILTPAGERRVEALSAGDLVLTPSGPRPVRWIGRRRLDPRRHAQPGLVQPVRVAAHAFGPGLPRRDLVLSPRHCIAQAGVLIPVGVLVDGGSVVQLDCNDIEYFRLELDEHDLVFAEGLPAESYMYAGLRSHLHADYHSNEGEDGGAGALTLHPAFASYAPEEDTCLPIAVAGPAVDAVKAALRRGAAKSGVPGRLRAGLGAGISRLRGGQRA